MAPKTKPQITQAQQEALNRDLLLAARDGHFDGVLIALEDGANVQAKFGDQELSALHLAALKGDVKLASYLLNRGADIEARSIEGDRALHLAALANHPRMVEFLLANGADVNVQNVDGISPLHRAVQGQGEMVVRSILDAGVDPHLVGDTLLGHAPALSLAENFVGEYAGTAKAEVAHTITHRIFRYQQSLEQTLPETYTRETLAYEDSHTVAALDQPRVWRQFRDIMKQMEGTEEGPLTKADLMKFNSGRARWMQRGVECHAAGDILEYLVERGENITSDELVTTRGEPTPLLKIFIENEEVATLLKVENWLNEGLAGFKKVLNALPAETRETLQNVHGAQAALQRAERSNGTGRGA